MPADADIRERLEAKAFELGFDQFGITEAATSEQIVAGFRKFVELKRYASMEWMAERIHQREHPQNLWPEAKSVIMLAVNYGPKDDPRLLLDKKDRANISVYARGKDYHDLVKKRLKAFARWIVPEFNCDLKVFVDTAPVPEKPLAAAAGLGWQGKHTNMVSPEFGSWVFLGAIYTDMELPADNPHRDQCGSCSACIAACPTDAFPQPYELDAARCISYLTIEHKGPIPEEFRKPMGNRIYGCDDCLAACPWNKFAQASSEAAFHARVELNAPELGDLVGLDDKSFREVFSGSPIKRIGRDRFVRNVLYAIGNSANKAYLPQVRTLLADDAEEVVDAAQWALEELS
ncbi:tRNA epoxyqueuosine(34) reductase QueG [Kordiimonas sp. SCSIO 12603]|uniref:tRNA epoxyqueuosine(34) reductase QueG n=1 Tax=Kordiimonas sp. SCSIO 12603 TaxID=2829596 RepID=UPI00210557CF|nr:tRNA epoxyqueuosine(34) reductase QueG [Kordiimonas sp. SCSIO 12603]UTW59186.1 tRNA epoxyqueuosine(34) reductase QueG [Kordiimonas sp. SCSIO 12603]